MKALTIRQPWAFLIMEGRKQIELRTWKPRTTGRILIHAGKSVVKEACEKYRIDQRELAYGAILGSVEITGFIEFTPSSWFALAGRHLDWGRFDHNLLGWELRNPVWLAEPLAWSGSLGLFDVPDDLIPHSLKQTF